jgi:hypothetical protein
MSCPIPAREFICAPFKEADDGDGLPVLDGYVLNTTHFVKLPYKTCYSTYVHAIEWGAGVITYECSVAGWISLCRLIGQLNVEATNNRPLLGRRRIGLPLMLQARAT